MWPTEQELRDRLQAMAGGPHAVAWVGVACRFAGRKYANSRDFTSGVGAAEKGGRFTPVGGPPTLYLAADVETAAAELAHWSRSAIPAKAFAPQELATVDVAASAVLDLTDPATLTALGITTNMLTADWFVQAADGTEQPAQALGRLVAEAGWEGLLAPSARRPGGVNVVLFPGNLRPDSRADKIDPDPPA